MAIRDCGEEETGALTFGIWARVGARGAGQIAGSVKLGFGVVGGGEEARARAAGAGSGLASGRLRVSV